MQFRDIIGQEPAVSKIQEAIALDRLPHALMLTGSEGVGQLALASAIAQYVNCLQPQNGDSCGKCRNCIKIAKMVHPDVKYLLPIISKKEGGRQLLSEDFYEDFRAPFLADPYLSSAQWQRILGGESKQLMISVHEIRELKRHIYLKAFEGKYKVLIVWQTEKINNQGANAFLKLLEEPPDQTLILMTCAHPDQLLATINSRCQRLRLQRIPTVSIEQYLRDTQQQETTRAQSLAAIAGGSISVANEYLEESTHTLNELYTEWLRAIYTGKFDKITQEIGKVTQGSKEFQKLFLTAALSKMRDSLMYHLELPDLARATPEERAFQAKFSQVVSPKKIIGISTEIEQSLRHIAGNANPHMTFTALSLRIHSLLRR